MNKRLILSLLGISLFPVINNNLILESEASNISKTQEDLSPLITYTTEKIGDREKMKVTVTVEDRSGSGIKEFRDYNNKLINGNIYGFEINKRGNYIFSVTDNSNNYSEVKIDDFWINPYNTGSEGRITRGSGYWGSSNIREWLNSNENIVNYTNNPPNNEFMDGYGYDNESGFLSNFSKKELEAIAITERRVFLDSSFDQKSQEGGTVSLTHLNMQNQSFLSTLDKYAFNYKDFKYKIEKDKVFLLNVSEFYWYVYRRNFEINRPLTKEAMSIRNITNNNPGWHLQYSANWRGYDWLAFAKQDTWSILKHGYGDELRGVVPAIHLKPNYTLDNGIKASDLNIGDKIYFGTYFNQPIEWEVIDITNDNYPLLLTTKSIDAKRFDANGDQSRVYSDYINYKNSDVSIVEDLEYKTTSGMDDYELPELVILNEEELNKRQNNGFSLEFSITDNDGSGIKYIELPDGNKTTALNFSYYFGSNTTYLIKYMDNAGNYNIFSIPIYNINAEPIVNITTSNDDTWTNQDVIVDIRTSNEVLKRFENETCSNSDKSGLSYNIFPNYLSYAGAKFKIKASVKLIKSSNPDSYISVGFEYKDKEYNKYSYKHNMRYAHILQIYTRDLSYDEFKDFEIEYTIPLNYSYDLKTHISSNIDSTLEDNIIYEFKDLEYELINDGTSDFKINNIVLPNGEEILDSNYRDIISEEGILNHQYKIIDSRGKETVRTITTKIDKTTPTLNLNYNTNVTNQNITVNINASDATSGVKRIKLPNGNYITNLNSTYTISGDGKYTFECEDVAGNITTKIININNIDKEKPSITIEKDNTEWTNKGVQININARD